MTDRAVEENNSQEVILANLRSATIAIALAILLLQYPIQKC